MARIRSGFKWGIFLSSYVPLYLILAYKHHNALVEIPTWIPVIGQNSVPLLTFFWVVLSFISLLILVLVLQVRKSKEPEPKNIQEATNRNDAVTNYILVYIFPFVVLDLSQIVNWVAFVAFFLVIGVIQVRSNHLYVNPILALAGYNLYDVNTENENMTLLMHGYIDNKPAQISAVKLSHGVYIAV